MPKEIFEISRDLIYLGRRDQYDQFKVLFCDFEVALRKSYGSKFDQLEMPDKILNMFVAFSDYLSTGSNSSIEELGDVTPPAR